MSKNNGQDFDDLYDAYASPNSVVQEGKDYDDEDGEVRGEQDTGPDENELDSLKGKPRSEQIKEAVKLINTKRYQVQDVLEKTDSKYKDDIMKELRKSDPIEEGIWDRTKARMSGAKNLAKDVTGNVKNVVTGKEGKDVRKSYDANKSKAIIDSHLDKMHNQLENFATDLVKLGITDEDKAEDLAEKVFNMLKSNSQMANLQKKTKY